MARKKVEIGVDIDGSSGKKSVQEVAVGLSQLQVAAIKYGDELERQARRSQESTAAAAKKAADEQKKAADDAARAAMKAADDAARAAMKSADRQAADSRRVAEAMIREANRAADAQYRAQEKATQDYVKMFNRQAEADAAKQRKIIDQENARIDKLRSLGSRQLSDDEVRMRAQVRVNQQLQARRVDDAADAIKKERGLYDGLGESISGIAKGLLSVGAATAAFKFIDSYLVSIRNEVEAANRVLDDYRESVLGIADLKDRAGRTTEEVAAQLAFRGRTLQGRDEAIGFQKEVLNTGQASTMAGFISKQNLEKLSEYVGAYQSMRRDVLSPQAAGKIAGTIPTLIGRQDVGPEEAFRHVAAFTNIIKAGGSDLTQGIEQFQKNAHFSARGAGLFRSPEQQLALQSFFSTMNAAGAGEWVDQFVRATSGAIGRIRKPGYEGSIPQGRYLSDIGAKLSMDPIEIAKQISKDLANQEMIASRTGKDFNARNYLSTHGYGNQEDIDRLLFFHSGYRGGAPGAAYTPFEELGRKLPDFAETRREVQQFQMTDPISARRRLEIARDQAEAARSMGGTQPGVAGFYGSLRELGFNALRARDQLPSYQKYDEVPKGLLDVWGTQAKINREIVGHYVDMAIKAGVPLPVRARDDLGPAAFRENAVANLTGFTTEDTLAKTLYNLNAQLIAKGVDPVAVISGKIGELADKALKGQAAAQAAQAASIPMAPPAIPGAPAPGMQRP